MTDSSGSSGANATLDAEAVRSMSLGELKTRYREAKGKPPAFVLPC